MGAARFSIRKLTGPWYVRAALGGTFVIAGIIAYYGGINVSILELSDTMWAVVMLLTLLGFLVDFLRRPRERKGLDAAFCLLAGLVGGLSYLLAVPQPVLNWLYDATGDTPGQGDPAFARVLIAMLIVWLIVQMVRVRKKIKKIAAEQAQQDTGWSGTGGLSPRESDQAPAGLAAGHAIVQAPADALIVIAGAALFMAIGVALWLGTAPGGWDPTASRFSAQEQLQSMLRDVSIVYVIYAAFMATAGLLMRRLRVRLFVLLCVVLVGVLLPTILALNVVMELEHIPAWPVLVPMWLGMPVAVWATGVLFRQDVREAFARPGVSVP